MYNGVERRKTMDKEIGEIQVTLAKLEEKVTQWMDSTVDYRKSLCLKQDKLICKQEEFADKLNGLPCKSRQRETALMWMAVGIVFSLITFHLGWK